MTSDVIYQSSKPSSMLSFHCCSESSHLLNFLARLLLHPHSLFVLQYGNNNKKNIQNINYTASIWQTYVGMKDSTDIFELFMFQATDNRLEALEQSIRTIILFKYYHVLILISCNQKLIRGFQPLMSFCCNLLIWSIQIMEGGFTNKKVLTEKDKNLECLRTCNHERRQTKLIRWINSLPTETFTKDWAIYLRQKMGKLANIMLI